MFTKDHRSFFYSTVVLLLALYSLPVLAQVKPIVHPPIPDPATQIKKNVEVDFLEQDIELEKIDVVSNVLRIVNHTKSVIKFSASFNPPPKWKMLGNAGATYELQPSDSTFIPVRLRPTSAIKGNTHFTINAFLISEDGNQLGDAIFFIHLKKIIKWDVSIGPSDKIYFLNNEKTVPFNVDVINQGNEQQEIIMTTTDVGNNIILSDTNNKIITKKNYDLNLKSRADTSLYFKMSYFDAFKRNQKRIDVENYLPIPLTDERKYTLYVQTEQPLTASSRVMKVRKKVTFVRLGNEKKVNQFGGPSIPITAEILINNIMDRQPIMNLVLRGRTELPDKSYFVYFSQTDYNSYYVSNNQSNTNVFNVGYYNPEKGNIQIGNVGGFGLPSYGKGVSGNYNVNAHNIVGGFITGDPVLYNPQRKITYGVSENIILPNQQSVFAQYSRTVDKVTNTNTDFVGFRTTFRIAKKHYFSFGSTKTVSNTNRSIFPLGTLAYLNYHGNYLNNKLQSNANATYSATSTALASNTNLGLASKLVYVLNKQNNLMLQNNYNDLQLHYNNNNLLYDNHNKLLFNELFWVHNITAGRLMPNIFVNSTEVAKVRLLAKGFGVDFNHMEAMSTVRYGMSLKGAYNEFLEMPSSPQFFTFLSSAFFMYKTVTFRGRYMYGPQSVTDTTILSNTLNYPQAVNLSLQHQYQFVNPRFVLLTSANYNIENRYMRQTFGFYPELHYASVSGWHFKLMVSYNVSSINVGQVIQNPGSVYNSSNAESSPTPTVNSSYNIGVGIKKEFNVPIPERFTKKKYTDIEFIAFYDVNGNHKRDLDEVFLENIVVRLGIDEVLTNDKGSAKLNNVEARKYQFSVFSLVDLKGWFSTLGDSLEVTKNMKVMYIPYVRGVKIYGNVIVDRTKYASDMEQALDLSGIRIIASDGITLETRTGKDGEFVFYAPYGTYILTMDESILGRRYTMGKNNIPITLKEGMESIYNSFYIYEKKRNESIIKFDSNGQEIKSK